jgi:hypothetical protein
MGTLTQTTKKDPFLKWLIVLIIGFMFTLSLCTQCKAQDVIKHNTISLGFLPADKGIQLRYDYRFVYTSVSYGNYKTIYGGYIKNHYKISLGIIALVKQNTGSNFVVSGFSAGLNYHNWGDVLEGDIKLNPDIYHHVSFELGAKAGWPHWSVIVNTDILRWEPSIGIGYNF